MKKTEKTVSNVAKTKEKNEYRNFYDNKEEFWNSKVSKLICSPIMVTNPEGYSHFDLCLQIYKLGEDNKYIKVKTDDDSLRFDNASFNLSQTECVLLTRAFRKMFLGEKQSNRYGQIFNHINKVSNSGTELDVTVEEEGVFVTIYIVENSEIIKTYKHCLTFSVNETFYELGDDGEIHETQDTVNCDIERFAYLVSSYAIGTPNMIYNFINPKRKSNSTLGGSINKKQPSFGFKRVMKNVDENDVEEESEEVVEEEEEKPAPKKTVKKSSPTKKYKNLKDILDDDEDED